MGEPWVLAVDLGTGGPKTGAVSLRGELLARAARSVPTRYTPGGGAVQDPHTWWDGIREGVAEVLATGVSPADATAVGITGQWASTVPVDAGGEPTGDCLLWADTRGGPLSARAVGGPVRVSGYGPVRLLRWLRVTGGAPSPHGADPLGHSLHLQHREREMYARTRTLLEPLDYLGLRFTGRTAATPASMLASWLTDNRPGATLGYAPALVRLSGRDPDRLPPLLPTGSVLGGLLPTVAAELGLPGGIPVVAGVPDVHASFLGSGAVLPFQAHLSISTTAWISCEVPYKRTDVLHQIASVPGPRPGGYLVVNNHETAGSCLQWLRDSVVAPTDRLGPEWSPAYDDLVALAARAPAGAGGVLFTPWLNGERSPVEDRTLRAAFINLSLTTERAHLVRAVLEGVAHNARWLLEAVERFTRRPLPVLRLVGGGATSELWCRIHADVTGRRVERVEDPLNAALRGAALFAAVSLRRLSFEDVAALVHVDATFDPDPSSRDVYDTAHREYRRLYRRLRGVYRRLNGGR